jgi:hypothetical protein
MTHFDAEALTIEVWTGREFFSVPLSLCCTKAQIYRWTWLLLEQPWGSPPIQSQFLLALSEASRSVFGNDITHALGWGRRGYELDWQQGTRRLLIDSLRKSQPQ